jgi:O-6-methylguanine DNA methyltransferase
LSKICFQIENILDLRAQESKKIDVFSKFSVSYKHQKMTKEHSKHVQKMPTEKIFFSSPVGELKIEIGGSGVKKLRGGCESYVIAWLESYFSAQNREPFPWALLDISSGTPFQQKVWRTLWEIPYGTVISYRDLARKVGCLQGFRAVGHANGQNPLPLLIPCHRVIAANGGIGGYSCGVTIKKKLLEWEGIDL